MPQVRLFAMALLLVAAATPGTDFAGGESATRPGTGNAVVERQAVMRDMTSRMESISEAIYGKEAVRENSKVVQHARMLEALVGDLPGLFPSGSGDRGSLARAEIWQNNDQFRKVAAQMKAKVAEFRKATEGNDPKSIEGAFARLDLSATCLACHEHFRAGPSERGVPSVSETGTRSPAEKP